MSSEEDWSIISSLSDLDDEGTIDSHEDHLPVDGGGGGAGNVSSIATLKIPVLESGSKERSDSGSSTVSGSTVLMSGTDKGIPQKIRSRQFQW